MRVNRVTSGIADGAGGTMTLEGAILVYATEGAALATLHQVLHDVPGEVRPMLGPGRCLTREALEALMQRLMGRQPGAHEVEILPEGLLMANSARMAWWTPAARRPIFFNTADPEFTREMDGRTVAHPPLVFIARPHVLAVFALAANQRPAADTPLCRAPYMNIYDHGAMCAGTTRMPAALRVSELPTWERAFWDTSFSHTNAGSRLTARDGGHNALWRAMADADEFPAEALLPAACTLQEAIRR